MLVDNEIDEICPALFELLVGLCGRVLGQLRRMQM
jgi:hypothetical protein